MTPADRALADSVRSELRWRAPGGHEMAVAVCGLDGAGKSGLCGDLNYLLGLPLVRVPDRRTVAEWIAAGATPGQAQAWSLESQLVGLPRQCVMDRGPLCVAAIHPEQEGMVLDLCAHRVHLTLLLDLPLSEARSRKADPEAEQRDREAEARRYRELAGRWPRTVVIDASQPPEAVLSAALRAVARAVGVSA